MSWNYRLFKQDTPESAEGEHLFFIGECYYDKNDKPELHSTMDHNHIAGSSIKEVREVYDMLSEAFDAPVIELDFEGKFKEKK